MMVIISSERENGSKLTFSPSEGIIYFLYIISREGENGSELTFFSNEGIIYF